MISVPRSYLDRIELVSLLYTMYRIATGTSKLPTLAWLAPAPICFALFRSDIYAAVSHADIAVAIRQTGYIEGAIWLGVAQH